MNFLAFKYFNEVAKVQSIRRAADRLHVAPSAVSRQLVQLEHSLGTPLLERTNTGVQLTAAGTMVERYTEGMFRELDQLRATIHDFKGLKEGTVKLSVIEGMVAGMLPKAMADFSSAHPAINFTVLTDSTDHIIEALIRNETDIGIIFGGKPRPEIEIIAEHAEPVMCLVAKSHPFARRRSITLAELCGEKLALPVTSFGLRQAFDAAVRRARLKPDIVLTANTLELIKNFATSGAAVTIAPALAATREMAQGRLKAVPIKDAELMSSSVALCIHKDRPLSYAARAFLGALRSGFEDA